MKSGSGRIPTPPPDGTCGERDATQSPRRLPGAFSPRARRGLSGFSLVELLIVIMILGLAAALVVPSAVRAARNERVRTCASNLRHLWQSMNEARQARGQWPEARGARFWGALAEGPNAAIEPDSPILRCPWSSERISYRGPRGDVDALVETDPMGADTPGDHGQGQGGTVLQKSGAVRIARETDPLWSAAAERTTP
ncbi:MAG: type II secretion system protein [Planctomycetes bacterium]|nr:type II secretion system protein [Planctomycetota bacterium]